jgi:rare lipoprotein A
MLTWKGLIVAFACLLCGALPAEAKVKGSKPAVQSSKSTAQGMQHGIASVYSHAQTSKGGGSDSTLTAAHRTFPFGTRVRVTNLTNGRVVVVRINDRGPFIKGRVIDLNKAAAQVLGISGLARVAVARLT